MAIWLSTGERYEASVRLRRAGRAWARLLALLARAEAEKGLHSLRAMVPSEGSGESRVAFFVMAARDAVQAARALTKGAYEVLSFTRWFPRLDAG